MNAQPLIRYHTELAFWVILFAEILGVYALYLVGRFISRYRALRREIARLRFELGRHQTLLHHRSDSAARARLGWAR